MEDDIATASDPLAVCSLPADGLNERLAWIRAEILPHAVSRETISGGLAWEFAADPRLAEKLERLAELERACCAGIVFQPGRSQANGRLRLEVRGIDPRAAVFTTLEPQPAARPTFGRRLVHAAGLGSAVSLLVCCVLPVAVGATLGAATAAPLASLDRPLVIAAAALLSGAAAFAWTRRALPTPASAPGGADAECGGGC